MKIWLDDERSIFFKPNCFDEKGNPIFDAHARTAEACIKLIKAGLVTFISFDHDLGSELTGYDVAKYIEERASRGIEPPAYAVHSGNTVGTENIHRAMKAANRLFRQIGRIDPDDHEVREL
jgi:hypothetical protein